MVRNARAKIRRTRKNYGIDLTNEIDLPKIESFQTRAEFNIFKEEAARFTYRGTREYQFVKNRYGVVASKKEINVLESQAEQARRNAQKYIEKHKSPVAEQRRALLKNENYAGVNLPNKFKFETIQSRRMLEKKKEYLGKMSEPTYYDERLLNMLENYKKILKLTFGSDSDEVIELLNQTSPEDFYELYEMYFESFNFAIYSSDGTEDDAVHNDLANVIRHLKSNLAGDEDMTLRGF